MEYTPNNVNELKPNEVFVFGSNLQGAHAGGAARIAMEKFGAVWGQGVGLQGQSYAIPTMQGGVETIAPYVNEFIIFAKEHPELTFLVTRIGCGIAGFRDEEIAPLFKEAKEIPNIVLPESFWKYSEVNYLIPSAIISSKIGQVRTMVDVAKALNKQMCYTSKEEFLRELERILLDYRRRGTVDSTSYHIFWNTCIRSNFGSQGIVFDERRIFREFSRTWEDEIAKKYTKRGVAKLLRIVYYMNEFRRYTDSWQIEDDLMEIMPGATHCGFSETFLEDGSPSGDYPLMYVMRYFATYWDKMTVLGENGQNCLDNEKIEQVFFRDHSDLISEVGIQRAMDKTYHRDVCHADALFPNDGFVGPVYNEISLGGCHSKFFKSCGEGKGPNGVPDWYEFHLVKPLLDKSGLYDVVDGYYIPREDYSLPVYSSYGKILFTDARRKISFISRYSNDASRVREFIAGGNAILAYNPKIDANYPWM